MQLLHIQQRIYEVRGMKVMLDFDLAAMFEVETKALNQAIKRNSARFPDDFMFRLARQEWIDLQKERQPGIADRSQIVTGSQKHRGNQPLAFTEHGVTMLASVLRSDRAVQMNIAIVRAFIAMRSMAMHYKELAGKIIEMEERYEAQFSDIYEAIRHLTAEKETEKDWASRERIGFKKS